MEYTHTHICPWAESKQSNKNKVPCIDPANKGGQKLYLPFKNKINCRGVGCNPQGGVPWICLVATKIWSDRRTSVTFDEWTSVTSPGWTSVTAPCYSSVLFRKQRRLYPRGVTVGWPKRHEEKRSPWPNFGSSFYMLFSLPHGPALHKLGYPWVLFILPEVLAPVLEPSFFFFLFLQAFPFFVF